MRMRGVAEMGAEPGAGVDGRTNLVGRGVRVADRNEDAGFGRAANELRRIVVFGRHGENPHASAGGLLNPLKLVPIRRADVLFRMSAPRPVLGRDIGAFDMNADHASRDGRPAIARGGERPHGVQQRAGGMRRRRRAKTDHSAGILRQHDPLDVLDRESRLIEFLPAIAVDLKIDETWSDPWQ